MLVGGEENEARRRLVRALFPVGRRGGGGYGGGTWGDVRGGAVKYSRTENVRGVT